MTFFDPDTPLDEVQILLISQCFLNCDFLVPGFSECMSEKTPEHDEYVSVFL